MLSYTVPTDRVRRGLVFRWHLSTQRKADQTYPVTLKLILWLVQTNIGLLYYQIRWGPFITIKPRCKQNIPIFNNISVRLFQWSRNHGGFLFPTRHWGGGALFPRVVTAAGRRRALQAARLSARGVRWQWARCSVVAAQIKCTQEQNPRSPRDGAAGRGCPQRELRSVIKQRFNSTQRKVKVFTARF